MRVTLLGHASLVFESGTTCVLMDPVFQDPFDDSVAVSCPKRLVHPENIPSPNAILLSHAHTDHFDVLTLVRYRHVPLFVPDDKKLIAALRKIGFRPEVMKAGTPLEIGAFTIHPTRSTTRDELGALFVDAHASVWNQVDTALDQDILVETLALVGGELDLAFCAYMPLAEYAGVWQSEDQFPRARYDRLVENALGTRARTLVPGSAGLAAASYLEWANPRVFPMTRTGFVEHLADIAPEQHTLLLDPGQTLVLEERGAPPRVEASSYAEVVEHDEDRRRFAPDDHPPPALVDDNRENVDEAVLEAGVNAILEALGPRIEEARHWSRRGPIRTLFDRRAVLQLHIALPSRTASYYLERWAPDVVFKEGVHPDPDYVFGYIASKLHRYVERGVYEEPMCYAFRRKNVPETTALPERPYRPTTLDPGRLNGYDLYTVVDDRWSWSLLSLLDEDQ